jgi:hypothetical protein
MRVGLSPIKTSPGTVDAARGYGHPEVSRMPQPSYRAVILRRLDQLGYANYNAYVASPHWRQTRQRYRDSDLPQNCYCCDEEKVELHHTTYERLGQELLTDLKPLCHACHMMIHDLDRRREVLIDLAGLFNVARAWKHRLEWRARIERIEAENEAYAVQVLNERARYEVDFRIRRAKAIAGTRGAELRSPLRRLARLLKTNAARVEIERQMLTIERHAFGGDQISAH